MPATTARLAGSDWCSTRYCSIARLSDWRFAIAAYLRPGLGSGSMTNTIQKTETSTRSATNKAARSRRYQRSAGPGSSNRLASSEVTVCSCGAERRRDRDLLTRLVAEGIAIRWWTGVGSEEGDVQIIGSAGYPVGTVAAEHKSDSRTGIDAIAERASPSVDRVASLQYLGVDQSAQRNWETAGLHVVLPDRIIDGGEYGLGRGRSRVRLGAESSPQLHDRRKRSCGDF